jgi:hypothetical protein
MLCSLLFSFLLATLICSSLVSATPSSPLRRRAPTPKPKIPDLAACRKIVKVKPDKALFWSGFGRQQHIPNEAAKKLGLWMDNDSYPPGFAALANGASEREIRKFQDDFSQAFAEAASGTVYVLTPADGVDATRVFASVEYPALKKNPRVKAILAIDPVTLKVTGPYKPLFKAHLRRRDAFLRRRQVDTEKLHYWR